MFKKSITGSAVGCFASGFDDLTSNHPASGSAGFALVFQNPEHQFLCDTVNEELAYSLLAQGIDDPEVVASRVQARLERLEIAETDLIAGPRPKESRNDR